MIKITLTSHRLKRFIHWFSRFNLICKAEVFYIRDYLEARVKEINNKVNDKLKKVDSIIEDIESSRAQQYGNMLLENINSVRALSTDMVKLEAKINKALRKSEIEKLENLVDKASSLRAYVDDMSKACLIEYQKMSSILDILERNFGVSALSPD